MKKQLWKRLLCGLSALSLLTVPFAERIAAASDTSRSAVTNVSVKKADTPYYYSTYGYGSLFTYRYTVSFDDIKTTAYCIQPMKTPPDSGTDFTVQKLSDGKKLAKVCYYGTKSSQENGFFSQPEYSDFTEGQKYILVHMAASYANGDPDAFSGASEKGRTLAMKLYNYCISQPDIPDVAMSFSKDTLDAYADGKNQRTPTVTFRADELQTITLKLPSGVRLHNESSGDMSAVGASVTISGGTRFYLSAPLSQAEQISATWSATMKGSITKDFSAYKVSTKNNSKQDLAFVFGEGVTDEKYVSLQVNWLKTARLNLTKTDRSTKHPLAGAVYGVFLDKNCSILLSAMPETNAKGNTSVSFIRTQDTIYIKEIKAPEGYLPDDRIQTVKLPAGSDNTSVSVSDKEVQGRITVYKKDRDLGSYDSQGDADIRGAVYGLYAAADIVHPDGHTGVLFPKGTLIAKQTIGASGNAIFDQLHLGKYYIQEIKAPKCYLPDSTKYPVHLSYDGQEEPVITRTVCSEEDIIKQAFELIKVSSDGSNTEASAVSGAVFTVKLLSDVEKNGWKQAKTYDTLTTDQKGYAKSMELPFGTYQVRETIAPEGLSPVKPFTVTISEDSRIPQTWRILNDSTFQAYLKLIKKDAATGNIIQLAGTSFHIRNQKTGQIISQKVGNQKIDTFVTDDSGTITTPLKLPMGDYEITELRAPSGYTVETNTIPFSVSANGAIQQETDEDGDPVIPVIIPNHAVTGSLTLHKQGELLNRISNQHFLFQKEPLSNVRFELVAAEDMYTPDHQTDDDNQRILATYNNIPLARDTVLATLTTDELGNASISDLPLGKYYLRETSHIDGFVSDHSQIYPFTLTYQGQDIPIVHHEEVITNQRIKTAVSLHKSCSATRVPLENAEFTLYSDQNFYNTDSQLVVSADTAIESVCTDKTGNAMFTSDLPLGHYYIRETKTPAGYIPDKTRHPVNLTVNNTNTASNTVSNLSVVHLELENKPTITKISKTDLSGTHELTGARLSVSNSNGTIIDSWISDGTPHTIYALPIGNYILREDRAPLGYLISEDISFSVDNSGKPQKLSVKNDTAKGQILLLKTDAKTNQPISGVTFELRDEKGNLLQTLTTDTKGKARSELLEIAEYSNGTYHRQRIYTLTETHPADNYQKDKTVHKIRFQYQDGNTPVIPYTLSLTNHKKIIKTNIVKTSDISHRKTWLLFSVMSVSIVSLICLSSNTRKSKKQQADK